MVFLHVPQVVLVFLAASGLAAQVPLDKIPADYLGAVRSVVDNPDFTFSTDTTPMKVRTAIMDKLFDHPRLAAAMWRYCQFVPTLYATEHPNGDLTIDDGRGLRGTLTTVFKGPGLRIFYIEGRVEKGRMGNPFAVGAKMVVTYRYGDTPKGFVSHLQTWTTLDSALLSFVSRPFRSYIRRRQQEFIAYINFNIAQGGAFAQLHPQDFRKPIQLEGDPIAIRQFESVFGKPSRKEQALGGPR